jgi:hypothetical protein
MPLNTRQDAAGFSVDVHEMTQAGPAVPPTPMSTAGAETSTAPSDALTPGRTGERNTLAWQLGIVVVAIISAAAVRLLLDRLVGHESVYLPFGLAVLIAARYGGSLAGHVASVLAALVATLGFIDPALAPRQQIIWFVAFLLTGLITTAIIESLRLARLAAESRTDDIRRAHIRATEESRQSARAQEEAERLIRDREARYRVLVESVSDYAIFMLDAKGRVMSWNAGAERIKGYTADEVMGRHFSLFYPADDQHAGKPAGVLRSALREGRHEEDGWRVRKDGTRLWANVVVTPVHQDGELIGFAKVVHDRTVRHSSDMLLESVLDSAIDGIIGIDENGTIRSFNAAAERMFDYEAAEVIGSQFSVLMPEPYRSNGTEYLSRFAHTGRIVGRGRELVGLRGDGTTFPLELAVSSFILDGRHFFTGVVRDMTKQRTLEEQLQQAQKMQAIGQLAGGVAHDFNNLLTIIAGHTELLLGRHRESNELHDALSDIRDAGMRAAGLTRQLLAFSRRAVLEPRVLDLNVVVREAQKMLRRIIGEDMEIVTKLAPGLPNVSIDQSQIGQVLINLVVNARDAVTHGGRIEIETEEGAVPAGPNAHPDARPGPGVVLIVRDNGVGMPPEIVNRIFEPFFTTKHSGAGTGLGLSMVYGIVHQSGGRIEVQSEPGAGTEFRVFLPAARQSLTPVLRPRRDASQSAAGDETLLVVEDEESVRRLAVLALREHGYRVLEACNGAEALRITGSHDGHIDLVVTDVVMPVMGGRQLVEALKPLRSDLRILYVSGYTDDDVVRHGVQRADVAFLQKPYTPHDLAAKVRRVLDGRD